MRAWGLEPEKILTREALAEPHRIDLSPDAVEKNQLHILGSALKDSLKSELLAVLGSQDARLTGRKSRHTSLRSLECLNST